VIRGRESCNMAWKKKKKPYSPQKKEGAVNEKRSSPG